MSPTTSSAGWRTCSTEVSSTEVAMTEVGSTEAGSTEAGATESPRQQQPAGENMDNADSLIASDAQFLPAERQLLAVVAASMVPPDPATGAPGAADATIFAEVCTTLSAAVARTRVALQRLQDLAGGISPQRMGRCGWRRWTPFAVAIRRRRQSWCRRCCSVTTGTSGSCGFWAWNHAPRFPAGSMFLTGSGRCSSRYGHVHRSGGQRRTDGPVSAPARAPGPRLPPASG